MKIKQVDKNNLIKDSINSLREFAPDVPPDRPLSSNVAGEKVNSMEESLLNELTTKLLGRYKTAASDQASAADKKGDTKTANKRFSGIIKATNKQFDNDKKKVAENRVDSPVSNAIRNRIIHQMPGLLKYGPDAVMAAIDWVADDVGEVEEIGSSDVSAWTKLVARYLQSGNGVTEGGMGWINRSAPAQDVSYEKTLDPVTDTWKGDKVKVTELSKGKEEEWATKANKWRDEKTAAGGIGDQKTVNKADMRAARAIKIANKHSDANKSASENDKYADILENMLEAFDANAFADILGKQNQVTKAEVVEIDFHGWTIKYRKGTPTEWMILDKKGEIKKKGSSSTPKDAVADAEEFIKGGGGTRQQASTSVTIDFNVDFAKEFAPEGDQFYATIDQDEGMPLLIFSTQPQQGLKSSHIRTQVDKVTSGTTKLPVISMSPSESNKMGLQPNGRYILGDKIPVDDNTAMFPLIYQGTVQGKGDRMRLGKPGLTVAHNRD